MVAFIMDLKCVLSVLILIIISGASTDYDNFILYADSARQGLYWVDLRVGQHTPLPIQGHEHPISVDYDPVEERVYWADPGDLRYGCTPLVPIAQDVCGSRRQSDASSPQAIAVDYISRAVYFADPAENLIGVYDMDLKYSARLITKGLTGPRSIALDPINGYMYFIEYPYGQTQPVRITKAAMDGSGMRTIIDDNLGKPNQITIDHKNGHLYWTDGNQHQVRRSDFDGNNIKIVISHVSYGFYGVGVGPDYIYCTVSGERYLYKYKKDGTTGTQFGEQSQTDRMEGLTLVQNSTRLTGTNGCSVPSGGKCSHMCAPTPGGGRTCICPDGWYLTGTNTCQKAPFQKFLLISDGGRRSMYFHDLDFDKLDRVSIFGLGVPSAVSYTHPSQTDFLFWTDIGVDGNQPRIVRYCPLGDIMCQPTILKVFPNGAKPEGVVHEHARRRVFVTASELGQLWEIGSVDSHISNYPAKRLDVSFGIGDKPGRMALDKVQSILYIAVRGPSPRIVSVSVVADEIGTVSDIISLPGGSNPSDLALDQTNGYLYMSDEVQGTIQVWNLRTMVPHELLKLSGTPVYSITLDETYIYYTLRDQGTIFRVLKDPDAPKVTEAVIDDFYRSITDIHFFKSDDYSPPPPPPTSTNLPAAGPQTTQPSSKGGERSISLTLIIIICASAGVVVLALISVVVFIMKRWRKKRDFERRRDNMPSASDNARLPGDSIYSPPSFTSDATYDTIKDDKNLENGGYVAPQSSDGYTYTTPSDLENKDDTTLTYLTPPPTPSVGFGAQPIFRTNQSQGNTSSRNKTSSNNSSTGRRPGPARVDTVPTHRAPHPTPPPTPGGYYASHPTPPPTPGGYYVELQQPPLNRRW